MRKDGVDVIPEVLIPLIGERQRARRSAKFGAILLSRRLRILLALPGAERAAGGGADVDFQR